MSEPSSVGPSVAWVDYQAAMKAKDQVNEALRDTIRTLTAELVKGERVFQAVVYAFEDKAVPEDLESHGFVNRGRKQAEEQLLAQHVLKRRAEAVEEQRNEADVKLATLAPALRTLRAAMWAIEHTKFTTLGDGAVLLQAVRALLAALPLEASHG